MPSAPKQTTRHHRKPNPAGASSAASSSSSTSASAQAGPSRQHPAKKPLEQRDEAGVPGISKLKASIRQTKRLLAKDNLQPGLRIATQRRLTSLEADLAKAERRNVEKKNGGKYHMVKFFERQKLKRLVKRFKKKAEDEGKSESKRSKAESDLHDARVMLNYILHFPNEQKYIALFPAHPPTTTTSDADADTAAEPKLTLPPLLHTKQDPTDKGEMRRLEILRSVRGMMDRGEISSTPEDEGRGSKVDLHVVGNGEGGAAGEGNKAQGDKAPEEADDFFEDE